MNETIKSVGRLACLTLVFGTSLVLFLGEEQAETAWGFILRFVIDKSLSVALLAAGIAMLRHWGRTDRNFRRYKERALDE